MEIVINSGSIYSTNSCSYYTGNECLQWVAVQSLEKQDIIDVGVSIIRNSAVFVLMFLVIGWIFRVLFSKFFGGRK